jgi:hypothetical protein
LHAQKKKPHLSRASSIKTSTFEPTSAPSSGPLGDFPRARDQPAAPFLSRRSTVAKTNRVSDNGGVTGGLDTQKYQNLMNFESQVLKIEFEKAERMLKKTDKLIEKYKDKGNTKTVKFALPEV